MSSRALVVSRSEAGRTVANVLRRHFHLSPGGIRKLIQAGRLRLGGVPCHDRKRRVKAGQRLEISAWGGEKPPKPLPGRQKLPSNSWEKKPFTGPKPRICFADKHIVVVDKPAGLTTVRHAQETAAFGPRARRFLPPTLVSVLGTLLPKNHSCGPERLRAVHRLDKETSGLVVLARTAQAERNLGRQFRAHTIERRYLALVRGQALSERIESFFVNDRGDGRRGSTTIPGQGKRAITNVRLLEDLGDFSLVECRLETGRTHQVRIHLGERGCPLCGERVYDRPLHGSPPADGSGATRPALHACFLALDHPGTGKRLAWTSPLPEDMQHLLQEMRQQKGGREKN